MSAGLWGARQVSARALDLDVFRLDPRTGIRLRLDAEIPASWAWDLRRSGERLSAAGPLSIFDAGDIARIEAELGAVPWLRRILALERSFPHGLTLSVATREPVARLIAGDRVEWLDRQGVLLPPPGREELRWQERLRSLPVIDAREEAGEELVGVPPYGAALAHPGILAGAAMAGALRDFDTRRWGWRLASIDTRGFARRWVDRAQTPTPREPADVELFLVRIEAPLDSELAGQADLLRVSWGTPPAFSGYEPPRGHERLIGIEVRRKLIADWMRTHAKARGRWLLSVRFGRRKVRQLSDGAG